MLKIEMRALWCEWLFSINFSDSLLGFEKWTRNKCPKLEIGNRFGN